MDLAGRVAIVTGASSGIGEATAVAFGRAGRGGALGARRAYLGAQVAELVRAAGGEALVLPTDIRDPAAIEAMVAATLAAWGRVDVLVANAGLSRGGPLEKLSEAALLEQIEVNLLGVIRSFRAVLPAMLARGSGHVIAISSVAGEIGAPTNVIYSATKAAVTLLCEGLRREVAGRGVAVTAVLPGFIATPMTERHRLPIRMPPASLVGQVCVKVLRRPRRQVVVPGWYRLLIGLNHWLPGLIDWGSRRTLPHYRSARPD